MTTMYCPNCKGQFEMRSSGGRQPKREQRLYFKRGRTCDICNQSFATVEVEENLIKEFEELKSLNKAIYEATRSHVKPLLKLKTLNKAIYEATRSRVKPLLKL